jgi:hypothetical protein
MKYMTFPPCLAHRPIRLNSAEAADPRAVIDEFFSFYDLGQIRAELDNWFALAISCDDEDMKQPLKRANLLQFRYQLEAVLEAVFIKCRNINSVS